jgi:hypothetical protein
VFTLLDNKFRLLKINGQDMNKRASPKAIVTGTSDFVMRHALKQLKIITRLKWPVFAWKRWTALAASALVQIGRGGSSAAGGPHNCQQPPSTETTRHLSLSQIQMNSSNDVYKNSGCFQIYIYLTGKFKHVLNTVIALRTELRINKILFLNYQEMS